MKRIALIVVVIAVVAGGAAWYAKGRSSTSTAFRTAEVKRGDLVATISATGTVEPEEVVDVGAQVAGQILSFGKDASGKTIDYGSQIEEGMILARIDDSVYNSDVASATAQLDEAKAAVARAVADLEQTPAGGTPRMRVELGHLVATGETDLPALRPLRLEFHRVSPVVSISRAPT